MSGNPRPARQRAGLLRVTRLMRLCNPAETDFKREGRNEMANLTAEIKGGKLIITVDLDTPTPSASGKTLVVASSRGNAATTATVNGQPVIVGLNAYIRK